MAESDEEQKTEQPTDKRLEEARDEGQLPISREMSTWFLFIATLIVIAWLVPGMATRLTSTMRSFLEMPHAISLEGGGIQRAMAIVMEQIGVATALIFALLAAAVIIGTMLQTGFYFNTAHFKFDVMRLSPVRGFQQMFSSRALVEFAKSFAKMVVIGIVVYFAIKPVIEKLPFFSGHDLALSLRYLHKETIHLIVLMMMVVTLIAVTDIVYQRYSYYKGLRMTKQEIKDEHKQMEGDPMVKSRLRSIRLEKARRRMMAQVPKADVVITNPTHYAVALEYNNKKTVAPVVVAKGMNRIAERIREVAAEHDIPLVSNPPLARALYDTVEVDDIIAPEHYRAVAEVISFVYKMRGRKG